MRSNISFWLPGFCESVLILNREHKSSLVFSYGNYDKTIVLREKLFKHGENMQQGLPLKHRDDVLL